MSGGGIFAADMRGDLADAPALQSDSRGLICVTREMVYLSTE